MKIHISLGNTKIGKIPNISLPPIITCMADAPCSKACYALKSWKMYLHVREAWQENLDVYKSTKNDYFNQIGGWLRRKRKQPEFFRFHVSGDIPDPDYFVGLKELCKAFPATKFLIFTKRFSLDFSEEVENLSVVLSMWPGLDVPDHLDLPKAWCQGVTETRMPEEVLTCPGNCETCGACWGLAKMGMDVMFPLH